MATDERPGDQHLDADEEEEQGALVLPTRIDQ